MLALDCWQSPARAPSKGDKQFVFSTVQPAIVLMTAFPGDHRVYVQFVEKWNAAGHPTGLWADGLRFERGHVNSKVLVSAHGAAFTFGDNYNDSGTSSTRSLVIVTNAKAWVFHMDGTLLKAVHSPDGRSVVLTSRRAYIVSKDDSLCRTVRCRDTVEAMQSEDTVDGMLRIASDTLRDNCVGTILPKFVFSTFMESGYLRAAIEFEAEYGEALDPWQEDQRRGRNKTVASDSAKYAIENARN
jgi:hypothetical protein